MPMSDKVTVLAEEMSKFLKILGVSEIPLTIIKQTARKIDSRGGISYGELESALTSVGIVADVTYPYPDFLEFDIEAAAGAAKKPKDGEFFNGHSIPISEVCRDLFTLGEFLYKTDPNPKGSIPELRSAAGFIELRNIFKNFKIQCELHPTNDAPTEYFRRISTKALAEILPEDDKITVAYLKKYMRSLEVNEVLEPFSRLNILELSKATEFLEVPFIAEVAIRKIVQSGVFNYNEAVAIYNSHFKCAYEPLLGYSVVCAKCGKVCSFLTERETNNSKCTCGESLFRNCNNSACRSKVARTVDVCPICGTRESDIVKSREYLRIAETVMLSGNLERADDYFYAALISNPSLGASPDAKKTRSLIDAKKLKRRTLSEELDVFVSDRKFFAAAKLIKQMRLEGVVNTAIEQRIFEAQKLADARYNSAKSEEDYSRVLTICADHPCAGKIPPTSPSSITLTPHYDRGTIRISWHQTQDSDVWYVLVRNYRAEPKTINDGEEIAKIDELFFDDLPGKPGLIYYRLFTMRKLNGIASLSGASNSVIYAPSVTDLSLKQFESRVEISYKIPHGATSIRVVKCEGNKKYVIYEGLSSTVIDKDADKNCSYIVTVCFNDYESDDQTRDYTKIELPKPIKSDMQVNGTHVSLVWSTHQTGFRVVIASAVSLDFNPDEDNIYTECELFAYTKEITSCLCEQGSVKFTLASNQDYTLFVFVGGVNGYRFCETLPISTNEYPRFNPVAKRIETSGDHIFVFDKPLHPNSHRFSYIVQKENTHEPKTFRPCIVDSKGYASLEIKVNGREYFGKYYVFYYFDLNNGKKSPVFHDSIHFRQNATGIVSFKLKRDMLNVQIRFRLERYDISNYSYIPQLKLLIEGRNFILDEKAIPRKSTSFTEKYELKDVGLSQISAYPRFELTPVDSKFRGDFLFTT